MGVGEHGSRNLLDGIRAWNIRWIAHVQTVLISLQPTLGIEHALTSLDGVGVTVRETLPLSALLVREGCRTEGNLQRE